MKILYTLLFAIVLIVIPRLSHSQTNNPPIISSLVIAMSSQGDLVNEVNLTENTSTSVYIYGTASDADSCEQIDAVNGSSSWKVVFFRSDVSGLQDCSPDNTNCYQDAESDSDLTGCDNPADPDLDYEMVIPVSYYADATDGSAMPDYSSTNWTAYVEVSDDNGTTTNMTGTVEINTLSALDVTSSIQYGALELGTESSEQPLVISNTGNDDDLDPVISDTEGWTCEFGGFGADAVTFNKTPELGWAAGTTLNSSPQDIGDMSIQKSSGMGNPTDTIYLNLKTPESGAGGSCSGMIIFASG
jgi:hypothetical protein